MSPAVTVSSDLSPGVDVQLFLKHGFYQHKNKLYFKTGKTEMAACMLHFFGNAHPCPNINNTTKPALADHVARFSNALCHIDEYKNNLEYEKIEFLKGVWVVLLASFRTLKDKLKIPKHGAQTRDNVLPKKSMEYYLMHSKEYFGRRRSCRFSMRNHINGDTDFETKPKAQVTTAMAYSYDKLKKKYGLSVTLTSDYEDDFMEKEDTDTLPF